MRRWYYVILGYAFIVFFFSIGVDAIDHALLWIFGVEIGYWFPNILWQVSCEGRNLHTAYIFALYSIIITALMARFVQPDSVLGEIA